MWRMGHGVCVVALASVPQRDELTCRRHPSFPCSRNARLALPVRGRGRAFPVATHLMDKIAGHLAAASPKQPGERSASVGRRFVLSFYKCTQQGTTMAQWAVALTKSLLGH